MRWEIYDIFYKSLLKQDIIRKRQVNKLLKLVSELDVKENKIYKVEIILNNIVYANKIVKS